MGMEPEGFDCVVVGGGLAGMVAANRLAERGVRTVVLERGHEPGGLGNARLSGGFLHIGWLPLDAPPGTLSQRIHEATGGHADQAMAAALAQHAGRAVRWLAKQGVEIADRSPVDSSEVGQRRSLDREVHTLAPREPAQVGGHEQPDRGPARAMRRLYEAARERGCTLRLGCAADELTRGPAGGTWEVGYRDRGERRVARAPAVLVADGGFQANRELLARHVGPRAAEVLLRASPASTGDGLRMLAGAGAAVTRLERVYGHMVSRSALDDDRLWPHPTVDGLCLHGLLVDRHGERHPTSAATGVALVNELVRRDDPCGTTLVMDTALWETVGRDNPTGDPPNPTIPRRGGTLHRADTVEGLAAAMGVEPAVLRRAVDAHDADPSKRPLRQAPLLAMPVVPGITFTMGGVRVDGGGAVLDGGARPITGLWAAGSTTGGLQGGPDGGYLGGLAVALVFGLLAAEAITAAARPGVSGLAP